MKVKYMGTSDIRFVPAGSNFGGLLAQPTTRDVVWDKHNGWVVDTDELGLSEGAVQLLLTDSDFLDVTGHEVYPLSEGDKLFRGMSDGPRTGTLPPGWTAVGELPTSLTSADTPDLGSLDHVVAATPADPVVDTTASTGTRRAGTTPATTVPASTAPGAPDATTT